jgi:hypothetical protein
MKYYLVSLLITILFPITFSVAASTDSIKVVVLDEKEAPVSDVKVFIEGNGPFVSNKSGTFNFLPSKKLVLPFNLRIDKHGFELEEFMYMESDREIEVRLKKATTFQNEFSLMILIGNFPTPNLTFNYNGKNYTTDKGGNVRIPEKKFDEKKLVVNEYKIQKVSDIKNVYHIHLVSTKPEPVSKETNASKTPITVEKEQAHPVTTSSKPQVIDSVKQVTQDSTSIQQEQLQEKVFKQYQQEFDNLSVDVIAERERLLETNRKIRGEIERLTSKLQNEKNLSPEQRNKLKKNIEELEKNLIENTIAYNQAEEKTLGLIQNLKLMVMQKDSINAMNLKKLKLEEEKRILAEKKTKRTLYIFTIITSSLVFLAMTFYLIARRMKQQKAALVKANEEMKKLKEQIESGLVGPA